MSYREQLASNSARFEFTFRLVNRCAGFANKMRMDTAAEGPKAYLVDSVAEDT
jgi:hypothetical protein